MDHPKTPVNADNKVVLSLIERLLMPVSNAIGQLLHLLSSTLRKI